MISILYTKTGPRRSFIPTNSRFPVNVKIDLMKKFKNQDERCPEDIFGLSSTPKLSVRVFGIHPEDAEST